MRGFNNYCYALRRGAEKSSWYAVLISMSYSLKIFASRQHQRLIYLF